MEKAHGPLSSKGKGATEKYVAGKNIPINQLPLHTQWYGSHMPEKDLLAFLESAQTAQVPQAIIWTTKPGLILDTANTLASTVTVPRYPVNPQKEAVFRLLAQPSATDYKARKIDGFINLAACNGEQILGDSVWISNSPLTGESKVMPPNDIYNIVDKQLPSHKGGEALLKSYGVEVRNIVEEICEQEWPTPRPAKMVGMDNSEKEKCSKGSVNLMRDELALVQSYEGIGSGSNYVGQKDLNTLAILYKYGGGNIDVKQKVVGQFPEWSPPGDLVLFRNKLPGEPDALNNDIVFGQPGSPVLLAAMRAMIQVYKDRAEIKKESSKLPGGRFLSWQEKRKTLTTNEAYKTTNLIQYDDNPKLFKDVGVSNEYVLIVKPQAAEELAKSIEIRPCDKRLNHYLPGSKWSAYKVGSSEHKMLTECLRVNGEKIKKMPRYKGTLDAAGPTFYIRFSEDFYGKKWQENTDMVLPLPDFLENNPMSRMGKAQWMVKDNPYDSKFESQPISEVMDTPWDTSTRVYGHPESIDTHYVSPYTRKSAQEAGSSLKRAREKREELPKGQPNKKRARGKDGRFLSSASAAAQQQPSERGGNLESTLPLRRHSPKVGGMELPRRDESGQGRPGGVSPGKSQGMGPR